MSKTPKLLFATAIAFGGILSINAQDFSDNFTTSGDFTANYGSSVPVPGMTQTTSGGPGGVGYLSGATGDGNVTYTGSSWDFSETGDTIELSLLSLFQDDPSSGGQYQLGIGAPGFLMSGATGSTPAFGSYRLSGTSAGATDLKVQYQYDNGGGTVSGGQSAAFALNEDDWYLFTVTFDNLGSGSYSMAASLYDYGTSGTAPVTGTDLLVAEDGTGSAFEQTETVTGASAVTVSAVDAGFRVNTQPKSGMGEFTDFDVQDPAPAPAPEPGVAAIFGLSMLLGAYKLRRK